MAGEPVRWSGFIAGFAIASALWSAGFSWVMRDLTERRIEAEETRRDSDAKAVALVKQFCTEIPDAE